jgi:hypothetical protein
MSGNLKLNTALGGSVALTPENTASNITVTVPATAGTMLTTATAGVPINGPAFSAYAATATSIATATTTKVIFNTEEFDTNGNFASSRFTPTVAGYYQINACTYIGGSSGYVNTLIYKNGALYKSGVLCASVGGVGGITPVSGLVQMNGTTDYIEIYVTQTSGVTQDVFGISAYTWFDGCLVRSAT